MGNGDFIRLHVAGASEASTMRNDLNCAVCGHKLEEDVKYRNLGGTYVCMRVLIYMYICLYKHVIIFIQNAFWLYCTVILLVHKKLIFPYIRICMFVAYTCSQEKECVEKENSNHEISSQFALFIHNIRSILN